MEPELETRQSHIGSRHTFDEFYRAATSLKLSKKSYCKPNSVAIRPAPVNDDSQAGARIYFSSYPHEPFTTSFSPTLFCADVLDGTPYSGELPWCPLVPPDFASRFTISLAESLLSERMRRSATGVTDFELQPDNQLVITASGRIFYATDYTPVLEPPAVLDPLEAPVLAPLQPKMCPFNARLIACVAHEQLMVGHTPSNTWTQLTRVDTDSGITVGMPAFVVQEEFDRYTGFWWQPVSAHTDTPQRDHVYRILYEVVDERFVPVVQLLAGQTVESHRYPRAGSANATSDLRICEFQLTDEGEVVNVRHLSLPRPLLQYIPGDFEYLVRAGWTPDGLFAWCQLLTRTQGRLELLLIPRTNFVPTPSPTEDPAVAVTGWDPCIRLLVEQDEELWVSVHDHLVFLTQPPHPPPRPHTTGSLDSMDPVDFIWVSHRSGYSHLYLMQRLIPQRGLVGSTVMNPNPSALVLDAEELCTAQLTGGSWEVTGSQIWVDEKAKMIYFESNKEHPLLRHIFAVSYALGTRGHLTNLTPLRRPCDGDSSSSVHDPHRSAAPSLPNHNDSACSDPDFPFSCDAAATSYPRSYTLHALHIPSGWAVLSSTSWDRLTGVQVMRIRQPESTSSSSSDPTGPRLTHVAWLQQHRTFDEFFTVPSPYYSRPPRVVRFDLASDPNLSRASHATVSIGPASLDSADGTPSTTSSNDPPHSPATYLYGLLFTPDGPVPPGGFPTIHFVYGGPNVQLVKGAYSSTILSHAMLYCHFGYALFLCDCRGSSTRGMQFAGHVKNRLGMVELDDHVAFLRFVAKHTNLIDLGRVAITGHSYGGYMSLMAAMRYSHVYRAAIAGSPVVDWILYDTAYTERYLGLPRENPEAYWNANVLRHVDQMPTDAVRLMICHGGLDENVHFLHTARLINELEILGKPFQFLYYPTSRHGIKEYEHLEASLLQLVQTVLGPGRPSDVHPRPVCAPADITANHNVPHDLACND